MDWALHDHNVFLTGRAGTGKSTLVRRLIGELTERGEPPAVTGSTGISALSIDGTTVHRWAGIQIGPQNGETFEQCADRLVHLKFDAARRARQRVMTATKLIVDEISMLPGQTLAFLDFWCRLLRGRDEPMGGISCVFVGDFLQLAPVRTDPKAPYDWAFQHPLWNDLVDKVFILDTVHRQNEREFTDALGQVRIGRMGREVMQLLTRRVVQNPPGDRLRLLTHNVMVDKWNNYRLGELADPERHFAAIEGGSPSALAKLKAGILAPETLRLKPGARVMHLINRDYGTGLVVNGEVGEVTDLGDDETIGVVFPRHDEIRVQRHTWQWAYFKPADGGPSFTQFPLRLSYALSIHKAQGLTLDEMHADIRAAREPGQSYVALSRVRTLAGMTLKEYPAGITYSPAAVAFYERGCWNDPF
jgi:ATP-dependent exoDNAse (exonuclease V) alpha subunit